LIKLLSGVTISGSSPDNFNVPLYLDIFALFYSSIICFLGS
jgi:hypothetical protein